MKARTHPALLRLQAQLRQAQGLMDKQAYDEARDLFRTVRSEARRLGVDSAYVAWGLAVASDHAGDVEMALDSIQEALERDPLSQPFLRSFDIIVQRIRQLLHDERRPAGAEDTPWLYALLQRTGEVDTASHLVMARYLVAMCRDDEALRLLDAVTLLSPFHGGAWLLKAQVARTLGRHEDARAAELEAASLGGGTGSGPVTFSIPGPARG